MNSYSLSTVLDILLFFPFKQIFSAVFRHNKDYWQRLWYSSAVVALVVVQHLQTVLDGETAAQFVVES